MKPKPVPDGKSGKPPTKSPRRSVGKSVERVKSPVLTNQSKEHTGANQSEPVGANDSKRAVPAIGKLQLGLVPRKPSLGVCEQHRHRPACACAQSDQRLC